MVNSVLFSNVDVYAEVIRSEVTSVMDVSVVE